MQSLGRKLEEYYEGFLERADPAKLAAIQRFNDQLLADGVAERALQVGEQVPDFTLPDKDDRMVSLREVLARGPAVVVFFRGGWCPFCTIALRAWAKVYPKLRRRNAELLAISPQPPRQCATTAECSDLPFHVLSDHDNQVARQFRVAVALPEDLQEVYRRFGHDLSIINGVAGWELPLPADYVISPEGRVVLAHVDPRPQHRLEPADVLAALEGLAQPAK